MERSGQLARRVLLASPLKSPGGLDPLRITEMEVGTLRELDTRLDEDGPQLPLTIDQNTFPSLEFFPPRTLECEIARIWNVGPGLAFAFGGEYWRLWDGRINRCETDEDGFLLFVEPWEGSLHQCSPGTWELTSDMGRTAFHREDGRGVDDGVDSAPVGNRNDDLFGTHRLP